MTPPSPHLPPARLLPAGRRVIRSSLQTMPPLAHDLCFLEGQRGSFREALRVFLRSPPRGSAA